MTEDIVFIVGFFFTVIVLSLGIPIVRAYSRRRSAEPPPSVLQIEERLARIETAIDSMSVEVERISEGQRFVTRLLAEQEKSKAALPERTP